MFMVVGLDWTFELPILKDDLFLLLLILLLLLFLLATSTMYPFHTVKRRMSMMRERVQEKRRAKPA